jgi:hypothetical protein
VLEVEESLNAGKCLKTESTSQHEIDSTRTSGYGSNLTFDGKAECDAAIMDGRTGDFGSVGALSGEYTKFLKLFHLNNVDTLVIIGLQV